MTPNFFRAPVWKKYGRFYRVDFTGYPSNRLSGYRLNGLDLITNNIYFCIDILFLIKMKDKLLKLILVYIITCVHHNNPLLFISCGFWILEEFLVIYTALQHKPQHFFTSRWNISYFFVIFQPEMIEYPFIVLERLSIFYSVLLKTLISCSPQTNCSII